DRVGACSPTNEFCGSNSVNRVNPAFGTLRFWENSVNSSYNAMQAVITKRFTHGYAITGNYTWAKSLDYRSTWHSGATTSNGAQEGYSTDVSSVKLDYGRSVFNSLHSGRVHFNWDLPFFRNGSTFRYNVLGGWQMNGSLALQSGQPFTPFDSRT